MIIKIMPENDIERAKMKAIEHTGVKEFFIFGNKKDEENESLDFHEWSGSYRYLVGSLYYFTGMLSDEMSGAAANPPTEIQLNATPKEGKLIKRGGPIDGQIEGVIEVGDVKVDSGNPQLRVVEAETVEEEVEGNDSSKGAEE